MQFKQFILLTITAVLFLLSGVSSAQFNPDDIVEIRIDSITRNDLQTLTTLGADIDGVWENSIRAYVTPDVLEAIRQAGYQPIIVKKKRVSALSAGYPSFDQLTETLKTLSEAYPHICRLHDIGKSIEGRELWFMQISDHVDIEEDEPEVKYISSMHGDEPVGMMLLLNLIHLLLEAYDTDDRITTLVNETEIWIMPLMNPDGYVHFSRYNMQGKDLNRSFPDRVADPVNKPEGRPLEVQHLMRWGFDHYPVLSANFHTGAMVVNYPYDSDPNPAKTYSASSDDSLFIRLALTYSTPNIPLYNSKEFPQGITNGVNWYTVYGSMQDWNYVWRGCKEVTIEVSDNKWPSFSQISGLWEDNRESLLAYMEWALKGVRGVVTDAKTGKPVGAKIRVSGADHDDYSDPDIGDYHRILLPGTYTLTFSAEGYVSKSETLDVKSGPAVRRDVQLSLAPETVIQSLANAAAVYPISRSKAESIFFKIQVPSNAAELRVISHGGTGDADLYVRYGQIADQDFDDSSTRLGNDESIRIVNPLPGDWYILVYAFQTFENLSLTAAYNFKTCLYEAAADDSRFPSNGGSGILSIITDSECIWNITGSGSWIEWDSDITKSGAAQIEFHVKPNSDVFDRKSILSIMGKTIELYQEGAEVEPDLESLIAILKILTGQTPCFMFPSGWDADRNRQIGIEDAIRILQFTAGYAALIQPTPSTSLWQSHN